VNSVLQSPPVPAFSGRLGSLPPRNRLTQALVARRAAGLAVVDLTISNPTEVGLSASVAVLAGLAAPDATRYEPQPRGHLDARFAVAADYARRDPACAGLDPDRIVLTASTSEAYAFLFKLLCDPGDEVLVPVPGYPLFDHLAGLEAVKPAPYTLRFDGDWHLDLSALERAVTPRTRAVIIVSPHNPAGWVLTRTEHEKLTTLCLRHEVALIADEVFADYSVEVASASEAAAGSGAGERPVPTVAVASREGLRFSLGGLSKSAGLPQMKVAWIVAGGADAEVDHALERLDLIADTYLSVATPQQVALPRLLEAAPAVRSAIRERLGRNRAALATALAPFPACTLLPSRGGWSAVVRLPATRSDEEDALELLEEHGVLVQPGYFFDFGDITALVISLLPEPATFTTGARRLADWLTRRPGAR
jgi:alanine-synthesizing transaminase